IESEERALASDAPEMNWSHLSGSREVSGRALRMLLGPAVKRAERARASAERAFIRAAQMGLSIGKEAGLFPGIGDYDRGELDHTFAKRDILPVDLLEEAQIRKADAEAALLRKQLGWTDSALQKELGLTDQEIEDMAAERVLEAPPAIPAIAAVAEEQQPTREVVNAGAQVVG
ncbi:MAG TPA: hypothetical protein VNM48_22760, partial [Chloroflexota bacterium]|nr:hypothetical protein [Chloroflexota bacterium]